VALRRAGGGNPAAREAGPGCGTSRPLDVTAAWALIRAGDRLLGQAAVLGA